MRLRSQNKASQPKSASTPVVDVILAILAFSIIVSMSLASQFQTSKSNPSNASKEIPNVEAADGESCQPECRQAN